MLNSADFTGERGDASKCVRYCSHKTRYCLPRRPIVQDPHCLVLRRKLRFLQHEGSNHARGVIEKGNVHGLKDRQQ